jgi:hypothetical protein
MGLRRSLPVLLSVSLLASRIASAEPISIASGTATTTGPALSSSGNFNLIAADGTVIIAHWPDFTFFTAAARLCQSCPPGTEVSAGARIFPTGVPFLGQPDPAPSGSVGGMSMAFDANLSFAGPPAVLPALAPPDSDPFVLNVPFTFGGLLNGYNIFARDPILVFSGELNGAGIAHLQFTGSPFGDFTYRQTTYEFQPTPEPATATTVLLAGGLTMLYRRRYSSSRRNHAIATTPTGGRVV